MVLEPQLLEPLRAAERELVNELIEGVGLAAAIDHLTAQNRATRDAGREIAIRNLSVFEGIARQSGQTKGTFSLDGPDIDLPRTEHNLPYVTPENLSVEAIRAGLRTHGCLLIRGLLDDDTCAMLRAEIDEAIAATPALDNDAADSSMANGGCSSAFDPHQPIGGRTVGGGARRKYPKNEMRLSVDTPKALLAMIEAYRTVGLLDVVEHHLGCRPVLASEKAALRRVDPAGNLFTGWHQDGAFLKNARVLNAWLSLSDCGVDAPGLEVLTRRLDDVVPSDPDSAMSWIVSHKKARELANDVGGVEMPRFAPGDCLLFDELFLHRTARVEGMPHPRYAIESWFFDPTTVADRYLPVYI